MWPRVNTIALRLTLPSDWGGLWYVDRAHPGGVLSVAYDEWGGMQVPACDEEWPIVLHSLSCVHLDTNDRRVNGSILSLVALVDRTTPVALLRDVQSPWNAIAWTGALPLNIGFGVWFDKAGPVATDKVLMTATYSHRTGVEGV